MTSANVPADRSTEVRGLEIQTNAGQPIVQDVSFSIAPGEILGLVGESGSGKTTVGLALLGYCRSGLRIRGGSIRVGDTELSAASPRSLEALRGRVVCYMPQDPATALNPFLRVGSQLAETFAERSLVTPERLKASLEEVRLPPDDRILKAHTFELSGGQQQRMAMAMAFVNRPRLIVMDEPTTGLDVTTQAHVLSTIRRLCQDHGVSALYVSHDLAVVAQLAQTVAVMQHGRIVESGAAADVLGSPKHPYTRKLVDALPRIERRSQIAVDAVAPSLLQVRNVAASYGSVRILQDIDLEIPEGSCLALVGESGSGKTTLSRCIAGLHEQMSGTVAFRGTRLASAAAQRPRDLRRRIQYIFQNPYGSFNPAHTVGHSIGTVVNLFEKQSKPSTRDKIANVLEQVSLPVEMMNRYPREMSGGQRQRAAIARALAADPDLLICDETTSALDVSVQATVVELLQSLQEKRRLSMLFVTHNLPLVANIAQKIAVMQEGRIVEMGDTDQVLSDRRAEETQRLMRDSPAFPY
ncbi:ABC transporter ATP-binding protein [Mesorhizobium sp. 2RAF21]|uniref:ABC transporter ATP-binding protein n=1 Tax=Mesorhizobium sp. 2RAF21 TaxID=3232995 RepID=UPI003F9ABD77